MSLKPIKPLKFRPGKNMIFGLLLALMPIVQPIKSALPVTMSMAIIIILLVYTLAAIFKHGRVSLSGSLFIWMFFLYRIFNHGTSAEELGTSLFVILFSLALLNGIFDTRPFFDCISFISCLAAVMIIIQSFCHYIFGFHICLLRPDLLRDGISSSAYFAQITAQLTTGMSGGIYRPSAFFIEPSAYSLYFIPALCRLIFAADDRNSSRWQAILISLGAVFSTSGIGIAVTAALWGFYALRSNLHNGKINVSRLTILAGVLIITVIIALRFQIVRQSLARIFSAADTSGYSAVQGRLGGGLIYLSRMDASTLCFGSALSADELDIYVSGIFLIILSEGIFGALLYAAMMLAIFIKAEDEYKVIAAVAIVLVVFAGLYHIHYITYYFAAILPGCSVRRKSKCILPDVKIKW